MNCGGKAIKAVLLQLYCFKCHASADIYIYLYKYRDIYIKVAVPLLEQSWLITDELSCFRLLCTVKLAPLNDSWR